jgi:uncharacterized FAD-dependent dehydrogenase
MIRLTDIKLPLDHAEGAVEAAIRAKLGLGKSGLLGFTVFRRGHDARKRGNIQLIYTLDVEVADEAGLLKRHADDKHVQPAPDTSYRFVAQAPADLKQRPIVIGLGPCGLFAGLLLAQMGYRPIILDRGKAVRERTIDTWDLWRKRKLDPESNAQFGEGGAGTFSDGKLHSQISDPHHHGRKVLTEFVKAGAPEEILYVSKPHIGTFRLVTMAETMRETIEALGGEIRFSQRVDDVLVDTATDGSRQLRGVVLASGEQLLSDHVVLAVGHSARDTFFMLHDRGVYMKPSRSPSAFAWSIRNRSSTRHALGRRRVMPFSALPTTSLCTTARMDARSTAFACVRAVPWSLQRLSRSAWLPTA